VGYPRNRTRYVFNKPPNCKFFIFSIKGTPRVFFRCLMKDCTKKHIEAKITSYQQAIKERLHQVEYFQGLIKQLEAQLKDADDDE